MTAETNLDKDNSGPFTFLCNVVLHEPLHQAWQHGIIKTLPSFLQAQPLALHILLDTPASECA